VPVPKVERTTETDLYIQATLVNGETCLEKIGRITLEPTHERREEIELSSIRIEDKPLIALCMATHNPRIDLFARQIKSIQEQTYSNWICIISDDNSGPDVLEKIQSIVEEDKRFFICAATSRLGFYRNFERCMSLVPK